MDAIKTGLTADPVKNGDIFKTAIDVAKKHGINLGCGTPNKGSGHCIYEAVQDNINLRDCYTEKLENTPEHYRLVWNMEGEDKVKQSPYYPNKYSEAEWENAWSKLQTTDEWDLDYFGDLVILSIAHSLKKDILVINTPWKMGSGAAAHGPINVASSDAFVTTNKASTEIPIVIA